MPRLATREIGGSLSFTANNSTAVSGATVPGADTFSVAWWALSGPNTGTRCMVAFGAYNSTGWMVFRDTTDNTVKFAIRNAINIIPNVRDVLNTWNRYVVTVDGSTRTAYLYCNGALISQSAAGAWAAGVAATGVFTLGSLAAPVLSASLSTLTGVDYAAGTMWSLADIQADYYNGTTLPGLTERWPLDDGAGTSARETVSGALPLTLSNGATFGSDSPMLLRGAVRNRVPYSESYASGWVFTNLTPSAYVGALPSGVGAMFNVADNAAVATYHRASITCATMTGRRYVASFYAKSVAGSGWLTCNVGGSPIVSATFNASTGVPGSAGYRYDSIQVDSTSVAGIYRCSFSFMATGSNTGIDLYTATSDGGSTYTGPSQTLAIGGFMVEEALGAQTTPSPYIATGAAPLSVYGQREWRQNLFLQSENVPSTSWSKTLCSSSLTTVVGPDGVTNIQVSQIVETNDGAPASHFFYQRPYGVSYPTGTRWTENFVVKAGARSWLALMGNDGTAMVWFNIAAGTVGSSSGAGSPTGKIRSLGNGWFLVSFTNTKPTANNAFSGSYLANADGSTSYQGNGSTAFYVWRAWTSLSNDATDYIPTTTAIANASGAPRSAAGARAQAGARVAV